MIKFIENSYDDLRYQGGIISFFIALFAIVSSAMLFIIITICFISFIIPENYVIRLVGVLFIYATLPYIRYYFVLKSNKIS